MTENLKAGLEKDTGASRRQLRTWFERPLGRCLIEQELRITGRLLERMFGYHLLQIGAPGPVSYCEASPISHRIRLRLEAEPDDGDEALISRADALPILAESMDVVILPHQLEYTDTPHKLLREIERILIGEGHLIIIAFNPWSLCGLWRLFLAWRDEAPWNGRFYRHSRIKDWLSLLDLELIHTERCFYLPPLQREGPRRRIAFLEKLGRYCWSYLGGIHIMVARKHVATLTPLKVGWRDQREAVVSGVTKPTLRAQQESSTDSHAQVR